MANFYFTYGTSPQFPFQGGWTRVEADSLQEAIDAFRAVHADRTPHTVNCAFWYTEEKFKKTIMFNNPEDTFWFKEHEVLNAKEILCEKERGL